MRGIIGNHSANKIHLIVGFEIPQNCFNLMPSSRYCVKKGNKLVHKSSSDPWKGNKMKSFASFGCYFRKI